MHQHLEHWRHYFNFFVKTLNPPFWFWPEYYYPEISPVVSKNVPFLVQGLLEIICTSTLFLKGKKRSCRLKSIAICKLIYKCIYKNTYLIKVCIHFLNPTFGQNHILKIKLYAVVNANLASSQFFRFKIKICIYEFLLIFA